MADDLARAQAMGEVVQKPKFWWSTDELTPMNGVQHGKVPVGVLVVASKLKDVSITVTGSYVGGDPTKASVGIYHMRGSSTINSTVLSFQSSWASTTTSIASPDWDMQPGDVIAMQYSQTAPGVFVPAFILVFTTEPS